MTEGQGWTEPPTISDDPSLGEYFDADEEPPDGRHQRISYRVWNVLTIAGLVIAVGILAWLLVWAKVLADRTDEQRQQIGNLVVQYGQLYDEATAKGVEPSAPPPAEVEKEAGTAGVDEPEIQEPEQQNAEIQESETQDPEIQDPELQNAEVPGTAGRDGKDGQDGAPGPTCPSGYTGQEITITIRGEGQSTVFACVAN